MPNNVRTNNTNPPQLCQLTLDMTINNGDLLSSEREADDVSFAILAINSAVGQYHMRPSPLATSLNAGEDVLIGGQELGPTAGNINEGKSILASPAAEGDHLLIAGY